MHTIAKILNANLYFKVFVNFGKKSVYQTSSQKMDKTFYLCMKKSEVGRLFLFLKTTKRLEEQPANDV
jgi:hypothetical protein